MVLSLGEPGKRGEIRWSCVCDCGNKTNTLAAGLLSGRSRRCNECRLLGLSARNFRHGYSKNSRTYRCWKNARARCNNLNHPDYKDYGGRGITFSARWSGKDGFTAFLEDMGHCPPDTSIDRIDNSRGYEPRNCRWATASEQALNRDCTQYYTHNGQTHPLSVWVRLSGIPMSTIFTRLRLGWSFSEAVTVPLKVKRRSDRGKRDPERARLHCAATQALRRALERGDLVKPEHCTYLDCTCTKVQAHYHKGYDEVNRLDVRWLCRHHRERCEVLPT
jgi:hypothetical protein